MRCTDFTAVDARARGLASHLFTRAELESLAGQDVPTLARTLARSPKLRAPLTDEATVLELERAVRQTSRRHALILSRWEGAAPLLGVFYAEQDRRSLRAMLRGALAASPGDERLAGLIPTPMLPERVLVELSRQPTPAAVVSVLFAVGHSLASHLLPLTAQKQPDLLSLELALNRGWAEWTSREAKHGDAVLRDFVAYRLDVTNLQTALLLANAPDVDPAACFLEGGREVTRSHSLAPQRGERVGVRGDTSLTVAPLLAELPLDATRLERAAFLLALNAVRARARIEPLSSAPSLHFLLRLEAQARDLRRVLWAAALGAPAVLINPELLTPP